MLQCLSYEFTRTIIMHITCMFMDVSTLFVIFWTRFLWLVLDLPVVLNMQPRVYLAKGMLGRLDCPTDANPPVRGVSWTKDGTPLQHEDTTRLKVCTCTYCLFYYMYTNHNSIHQTYTYFWGSFFASSD